MLNRVILIGRLTADPEHKYTPSGVSVTNLRIAVQRSFVNQQTKEREADFIDIVAWRATADYAANFLQKGRLISVDGRLQVRSYQAQDGTNRRVWEVVAESLQALEKARDQAERGGSYSAPGSPAAPGAPPGPGDEPPFDDPFSDE